MKVVSSYSWLKFVMLGAALVLFSSEGLASGNADKKKSDKSSSKKSSTSGTSTSGKGKSTKAGAAKTDTSAGEGKSKISVLADVGFSVKEKALAAGGSIGTYNPSGSGLDLGLLRASGAIGVINVANLHIGARYRYGIAKIAFIGAGLGLSLLDGTWYVVSKEGAEAQTESLATGSLKVVTLDTGLGLRIPLGIVLVGADLVDVSIPLIKMGSVAKDPAEATYAEDAAIQRAKFKSYAGGISIVSKVSIGIVF